MQRIYNLSFILAGFMLLAVECGCRRAADPSAIQAVAVNETVIGVSLSDSQGPWKTDLKADILAEAAKHPKLRFEILDAGNDAKAQINQLAELVKKRAKLLIIVPADAQELTSPVAKLFDAGIPTILLNQAVVGDQYTCCIAPDCEQVGSAAGEWLADKLAGKGKIVEIKGPVDSIPADQVHDAFRASLRDPGYRFVFEGFLDPPRVNAAKLMTDAMADVDQFDAVFAFDDAAAVLAHETAKSAGRGKGVLFFWRLRIGRQGEEPRRRREPRCVGCGPKRQRRGGRGSRKNIGRAAGL